MQLLKVFNAMQMLTLYRAAYAPKNPMSRQFKCFRNTVSTAKGDRLICAKWPNSRRTVSMPTPTFRYVDTPAPTN